MSSWRMAGPRTRDDRGYRARGIALLLFAAAGISALAGCDDYDPVHVTPGVPAPPVALDGWYYDRAVHLVWELAPGWDGESFRVYGKRTSDPDYFLVAEVTNCTGGVCSYTDVNLATAVNYEYFVVAVEPGTGVESEGTYAVQVFVPSPVPPPAPDVVDAVALDGAIYIHWEASSAEDLSHYRVHLEDPAGGADFFLGETDSEGFLDERVENGLDYTYRVSAVDDQGHESGKSPAVTRFPRPDFHGEVIWAHEDRPDLSGFRFQFDEGDDPILPGDDPGHDFRLEVDVDGWWIVPGPSAQIHEDAYATTALKCGPGSDTGCTDLRFAPTSGYLPDTALEALTGTTYVLRTTEGGQVRYGAIRVELLGTDQNGDAIAIFDWAYQIAEGVTQLAPRQDISPAF